MNSRDVKSVCSPSGDNPVRYVTWATPYAFCPHFHQHITFPASHILVIVKFDSTLRPSTVKLAATIHFGTKMVSMDKCERCWWKRGAWNCSSEAASALASDKYWLMVKFVFAFYQRKILTKKLSFAESRQYTHTRSCAAHLAGLMDGKSKNLTLKKILVCFVFGHQQRTNIKQRRWGGRMRGVGRRLLTKYRYFTCTGV